jgi:beta-mannosidase
MMQPTDNIVWQCSAHPPGVVTHPNQLDDQSRWFPAPVPGTVASALRASGQWKLGDPIDADASDWWYRASFDVSDLAQPCMLEFDGLATRAEVWLNGELLLTTDNMFRPRRLDVTGRVKSHNELVIAFRSLTADLAKKRSRPRWKTNLVNHQQLRWQRTTLLGRIPGWSPPVAPVGPWRAVRVKSGQVGLSEVHITTSLDGDDGVVSLQARIDAARSVQLRVGEHVVRGEIDGGSLRAVLRIPNVPLWWPHTHGEQPRFDASLIVDEFVQPCGTVGFRRLDVDQQNGLAISINGVPIFCRGACWTVADIVTLDGDATTLEHDLRLACDAGVNLLRVGGTMIYESDAFYDLCDELGILVWQDFIFANMDYPVDDPTFAANIDAEASELLRRLSRHPSVAVYCGNSEIEQQAAMLGVPRELWRNRFFGERLLALCAEHHPGTAYVPSTPSGGVLPFHVAEGVTHYYGVGAYLRSPRELRQADVKFTPECLGFANVPEPATIDEITGGALPAIHHPKWKERTPRDTGAGWDFEDVRDHYLKTFFGVNPAELRSFDMPRYLQLSRVVTGELMAQTFGEWRSSHSHCRGALVWFFKDLWPGAGWGVVDSLGRPKAAYYYLRRSWQPLQITLTDEALDGLHLHAINERAERFQGAIEILLLKDGHVVAGRGSVPCELKPREQRTFSVDAILGAFYDVTYAYRFGPPKHDVVIATLFDPSNNAISEAFYFVQAREPIFATDVTMESTVARDGDAGVVTLRANRFLQSVNLNADGYLPDDNYFHLPPDRTKTVRFRPWGKASGRFQGYVEALNLKVPVKFSAK